MGYNPYFESIKVLSNNSGNKSSFIKESQTIQTILEDVNSPTTRKYHEKMYKSIIDKAHIDFGDIPRSTGNIRRYSGYPTMVETLQVIMNLAIENEAPNVQLYVKIVQDSIRYIENLSATYEKGFLTKTEYVAMEYDTYVYFCVEATTALIYSFVDVLKSPDKQVLDMTIKNTQLRADEFYFEQLKKFNAVQDKYGIEYRKMLEGLCSGTKNNFIGTSTAIGIGAVMTAAIAIVPITREAVYQLYKFRGKLSENLEMQSQFLELNRTCVEANTILTAEKKNKIMQRQENLARKLHRLADSIRVKSAKSIVDSKAELQKDNKMLTIDNIKDEVSSSPFELI